MRLGIRYRTPRLKVSESGTGHRASPIRNGSGSGSHFSAMSVFFLFGVCLRPTLKIFLFPLTRPCLTGIGRSVGKLFYFTSQVGYPLNLIVNSPTLGNNIKYTNNLQLRIFF